MQPPIKFRKSRTLCNVPITIKKLPTLCFRKRQQHSFIVAITVQIRIVPQSCWNEPTLKQRLSFLFMSFRIGECFTCLNVCCPESLPRRSRINEHLLHPPMSSISWVGGCSHKHRQISRCCTQTASHVVPCKRTVPLVQLIKGHIDKAQALIAQHIIIPVKVGHPQPTSVGMLPLHLSLAPNNTWNHLWIEFLALPN